MKRYFYLLLITVLFSGIYGLPFIVPIRVQAEEDCIWGEWITDREPTCTQAGHRYRICILDPSYPHEENEIIPPLGHDYDMSEVAPNCTSRGVKTYKCRRCGYTYSEEYGDLAEHSYKKTVTKQPTCEEDGEITYTCTVCGVSYTETIDKTGHEYKETTVKVPDCTGVGLKKYVCSRCNDSYTEEFGHIQPHLFERKTEVTNNEKIITEVCRNCGYTHEIERTEIQKSEEPKVPEENTPEEDDGDIMTAACIAAGAADIVLFGGFAASILSDVSVLRWYKNRKKQITELRKAAGGRDGKL